MRGIVPTRYAHNQSQKIEQQCEQNWMDVGPSERLGLIGGHKTGNSARKIQIVPGSLC